MTRILTGACALALTLPGCTGGSSQPLATPAIQGSIVGVVRAESDGSPVEGAIVTTTPATRSALTDATGRFATEDLEIGRSYDVTASKDGVESASARVTLSASAPSASVVLTLLDPARGTPRDEDTVLDVEVRIAFDQAGVTFEVLIRNASRHPIPDVVIVDTLLMPLPSISSEGVTVNTLAFPNATWRVEQSRRALVVDLGTVAPVSYVRAFTFRTSLPEVPGASCNWARVRGGAKGEHAAEDTACLVWGQ